MEFYFSPHFPPVQIRLYILQCGSLDVYLAFTMVQKKLAVTFILMASFSRTTTLVLSTTHKNLVYLLLFFTARNTPEYGPVFYRIGTDFHIQAYEDRIREYTGSYSGVFHAVFVQTFSERFSSCFKKSIKNFKKCFVESQRRLKAVKASCTRITVVTCSTNQKCPRFLDQFDENDYCSQDGLLSRLLLLFVTRSEWEINTTVADIFLVIV